MRDRGGMADDATVVGRIESSETVEALLIDLLDWLASGARPYVDVMDAWRTSCPRLPVWEEANSRGFVTMMRTSDHGMTVAATAAGLLHLERHRSRRP